MGVCSSKQQSNTIQTEKLQDSIDQNNREKSWSDLPMDLLQPIAESLGLIDLLSFRAVCKHWRSASSTASAETDDVCFLYYGKGSRRSKCVFFHNKTLQKKYKINMPELNGATCLASKQGWLLVFQTGSIFFFCPFSRAKIYLPPIPDLKIVKDHVAGFSTPPTCADCVVSVINRRSDEDLFEINVLERGDNRWTKYEKPAKTRRGWSLGEIIGADYHDGNFYYFDDYHVLGKFCLMDKGWNIGLARTHKYESKWITFQVFTCGSVFTSGYSNVVVSYEHSTITTRRNYPRNLTGVFIQPRFFQIPPNQTWYHL